MNEDPKACGGITPLVWFHVAVVGIAAWGLVGYVAKALLP